MKDILYITFVDFNNLSSASSLRPYEIYRAFLNNGYRVTLLTGLQNRVGERWKNAFNFFTKIRKKKFDFCYIELPSGPIFNFCDHLLIMYIKSQKIPVGIFYRDAYWKFASWYNLSKFKKIIITLMHKFDLFVFKHTCKIIYFPSDSMADLFEMNNKLSLPPACRDDLFNNDIHSKDKAVYIGGISKRYGTDILLNAFDLLNLNRENLIYLNLVCREVDDNIKPFIGKPWLKIHVGVSGDSLKEIYRDSDFAIIPFRRDIYMDFAVPVKLYEYMSFGMPIIATNCVETKKVIEKYNVGLVCSDNPDSLKDSIQFMHDHYEEHIAMYKVNIKKAVSENLWTTRINFIDKTLTDSK